MADFMEQRLLQRAEDQVYEYQSRWGILMHLTKTAAAARRSWEKSENLAGMMSFDHYKMLARRAENIMDDTKTKAEEHRALSEAADREAGAYITDNLYSYRRIAAKMAREAGVEIQLQDSE